MPYEDKERICEESRGHRKFLLIPLPSRRQPCKREEHPSRREETLRADLGTPSMGFETPNEERAMPTAKLRGPRRHPRSLPRFVLDGCVVLTLPPPWVE